MAPAAQTVGAARIDKTPSSCLTYTAVLAIGPLDGVTVALQPGRLRFRPGTPQGVEPSVVPPRMGIVSHTGGDSLFLSVQENRHVQRFRS